MDDDRDHERMARDLEARLKRQTDGMMHGMIEAMAPMLGGAQLLADEARAWDGYVSDYMRSTSALVDYMGDSETMTRVEAAVRHADEMIAERRKRFNEAAFAERMRGMLPSGKGLCNKPILRESGEDTGHRCPQNVGHSGICF